jgi:hypothetical protein
MALQPPRNLRLETGASVLDYELLGEKAATLGRLGERAAKAVNRLAAFDAAEGGGEGRLALVQAASEAVWHFFIQRELCGFRDHRLVTAELRIPREVLTRLGAAPKR